MILRYFYIDKYNEVAQNLDVNLGGKYSFHYYAIRNELKSIKNKEYVENLYKEYNVISDVSAILGKNSAGKTTILRMINSIFNGFDSYNKKQYIIMFEEGKEYILYTNYIRIKHEEKISGKRVRCIEEEYFNAIDVLNNVGLIYFSNIFDKATPFQGNANLIDISTNYLFGRFYSDNIRSRIRKGNEKNNMMEEYKADNILAEIDFLLDIKNEMRDEKADLLFEVPMQIELGFLQNLSYFENVPFCENKEYNCLLEEISRTLEDYLCENQEFKGENIVLFRREVIFYFLFDTIGNFCSESRYDMAYALKCWKSKIDDKNWEISDYYWEILEAIRPNDRIITAENMIYEEDIELEESYLEESYGDIWEDFEWICNQLSIGENFDWRLMLHKIVKMQNFFEREQWKNYHMINYYLKEAEYLLESVQEDLIQHDYDLYNITYIYDAYEFIEEAYNACSGEKFAHVIFDVQADDNWIEEYDEIEIEKIESQLDVDTESHIDFLRRVINMFLDFTKRYEYDADANMLKVKLDCEDILDFIDSFNGLNLVTVDLDIKRMDISSGHSAYLDMCARINSARKSGEIYRKENIIMLIDEGDIYLHPEKQLAYINNLMRLLQMLYKGKKVQLIVTSNSPFIISDIQTSNILYLEKRKDRIEIAKSSISNTFAANVNVLLVDSFFVKNGLIGEFARKKIGKLLQNLQEDTLSEDEYVDIESIIKIIGEPIIKRKLETMLFHNTPYGNVLREIQYYENLVKQMKRFGK